MVNLWVWLKPSNPTKVSMDGCNDVNDFNKAVKKKLQIPNPTQEIFLSTTDGGPVLRPRLALSALSSQPGYTVNDGETPLFVVVCRSVSYDKQSPIFGIKFDWKATACEVKSTMGATQRDS